MSTIAITPARTAHRPVRHHSATRPSRPASARPVRRAAQGEVRLTRRGRLVVFLGALFLALAFAVWFGAGSAATDHPEQTRVVTVTDGDTLWDIAEGVAPAGEVSDMVVHLEQLNHMDSAALQAGQKLLVPVAPR
ncbi:MAG: LysM peptidoglycan-binding domain-containing protein [Nocardioidaceae bacterium]